MTDMNDDEIDLKSLSNEELSLQMHDDLVARPSIRLEAVRWQDRAQGRPVRGPRSDRQAD